MRAKTTKKKVTKKVASRKPRVVTREQRIGSMFELTNEAYNRLMETHLKLVEKYNELLEQNTSLRIQVYRLELLSGTVLDGETTSGDPDWESMVDKIGNPVAEALQADDVIYGRQQRPVNQQRNTNDLYRIAKEKHAEKHAKYEERLQQYAEQEEVIDKALAEARVSQPDVEVRLSEEKKEFYVNSAKVLMENK